MDPRLLLRATVILFTRWLIGLLNLIRTFSRICAKRRERKRRAWHKIPVKCMPIPREIMRRPDPSIYSQEYLMSLGMAVTWDNPDIQLKDVGGVPVDSYHLAPNTEYTIEATIHNRSNEAPALAMPVVFHYFRWGIGVFGSVLIGTDVIDLPVRGGVGEPAVARTTWRTPAEPGHYCIQVEAICPDDLNPLDNLGQENTDVIAGSHSPVSVKVPVQNRFYGKRTFQLAVDGYRVPDAPLFRSEKPSARLEGEPAGAIKRIDPQERMRLVVEANRRGKFPVPDELKVRISKAEVTLQPRKETEVVLSFEKPEGGSDAWRRRKHINLVATDRETGRLIGGITIVV